jgi:hypothetical protein
MTFLLSLIGHKILEKGEVEKVHKEYSFEKLFAKCQGKVKKAEPATVAAKVATFILDQKMDPITTGPARVIQFLRGCAECSIMQQYLETIRSHKLMPESVDVVK